MDIYSLIKLYLVQIIENRPIDLINFQDPILISNTLISEYTIEELLALLIPFLKAYHYRDQEIVKSKEHISKFIEIIKESINYSSFEDSQQETPEYLMKQLIDIYDRLNNEISRTDKLLIHNIVSKFKHSFVDWNDREVIYGIIQYCICRSIQIKSIISREETIEKEDKINVNKTKVKKLLQCGHSQELFLPDTLNALVKSESLKRSEILRRRIVPTMSLDEYAEMAMEDMRRREEYKKEIDEIEFSSDESKRETKIAGDDFKDSNAGFKGNIRRQG